MEVDIINRINQIIEAKKLSGREFAAIIGSKANTFNQQINSKRSVSYETVKKILSTFEDISSEWLLRGEGDMLKAVPHISYVTGRPYYNVDFIGGFDLILNDQTINPDYNIDFAPYNKDGVMWCNITGHSMEPEINSGDILAIREVPEWNQFIVLDDVYAIVTKNELRTVKRVKKGSSDNKYLLVPTNPDYSTQEIGKEMIYKVFSVLGCMKRL